MIMEKTKLEKNTEFLLNIQGQRKFDPVSIFGNNRDINLEIGAGRGEFLIKKSKDKPRENFIAFEIKYKRIKTILRKLDPEVNCNVRVCKCMVNEDTIKHFTENSIKTVYINHPDPWPKRRHHKRRLIQDDFIEEIAKIVKINGTVCISTDHEGYSKWIMKKFDSNKSFSPIFEYGFTQRKQEGHISTFFEIKKRKEGYDPFFMHYKKVL